MKLLKSFLLGIGFLGLTTTLSFATQGANVVTVVETHYVVENCEPTPPVQASEPFAPLAIMAALAGMSVIRRKRNI